MKRAISEFTVSLILSSSPFVEGLATRQITAFLDSYIADDMDDNGNAQEATRVTEGCASVAEQWGAMSSVKRQHCYPKQPDAAP